MNDPIGRISLQVELVAGSTRAWIQAGGVLGFALATALGAQITVPVPGTPVPITLQTLFVVLAGMTLGPRLGAASMGLYLLLGMTGYHVFSPNAWGAETIFRSTGGYLLGFLAAAPVIGHLTRRAKGGVAGLTLAAIVGSAIIFGFGLGWLHVWMSDANSAHTLGDTVRLGLIPFVPGLIGKTVVATAGGRLLYPISRKYFDVRGA
ncbi:MAG: biotin transporter BioY [Phycisphaerae bacterium]